MSHHSQTIAGVTFARQPVPYWLKSEARLKQVLLELAADMLGSHDDALHLVDALKDARSHPHKADFIQLAYPVIKAWATTRSAISRAPAATRH